MSLNELLDYNRDIKDIDNIQIGQKIKLKASPLPRISHRPQNKKYKPIKFSSLEFQPERITPSNNTKTSQPKKNNKTEIAHGKTSVNTKQEQQANVFSIDKLKNFGKGILNRVFGDRDLITGRTNEEEKRYQRLYNTPYNEEMDRGEPLLYRHKNALGIIPDSVINNPKYYNEDGSLALSSQLGDLGLYGKHKDNSGRTCYRIKDDKGNIVTDCSKTGNLITRAMGVPTTDHAWKREGVYGDSLIYGQADHNKIYGRYAGKLINSLRPSQIDPNNLQSGDFVDLYTEGSGHNEEAKKTGRGNSHTGTVFKPYGKTGPAYIIHNVGGDVYVDPLASFGPLHTWGMMGIRRPGSKEHPFIKEN